MRVAKQPNQAKCLKQDLSLSLSPSPYDTD